MQAAPGRPATFECKAMSYILFCNSPIDTADIRAHARRPGARRVVAVSVDRFCQSSDRVAARVGVAPALPSELAAQVVRAVDAKAVRHERAVKRGAKARLPKRDLSISVAQWHSGGPHSYRRDEIICWSSPAWTRLHWAIISGPKKYEPCVVLTRPFSTFRARWPAAVPCVPRPPRRILAAQSRRVLRARARRSAARAPPTH